MTAPTITYKHGYLTDCDVTTGYTMTNSGLTGASFAVSANDYWALEGTCDDTGDEYMYVKNDSALGLSTNAYPKCLIRWRTSVSGNGLGAQVIAIYSDASQQYLVGSATPIFSTDWVVTTGTLTESKTLNYLAFYANDYPNSVNSGLYRVYYDFALICVGQFTFPFVSTSVDLEVENRYADMLPPGFVGTIQQYMGLNAPTIRLSGTMDTGTGWHGNTTLDGERLYTIMQKAYTDKWQWFTSDVINCKVIPRRFEISQDANTAATRRWSLELKKYELSAGDVSNFPNLGYWGF